MSNQTKWSCSDCGYLVESDKPPERCPQCQKKCTFIDATCYTPECGGPQNVDPNVIARRKASSTTK
ncbi:MAG: rubredoxin-like domain-containing protein [candidate division WOR-3 bacterium]